MHHEPKFRFCPACGGKLNNKSIKEHEPNRLICSDCNFILYLDPKLVACAIVEMEGRILLLKRAIKPQAGKWVIPGGYVDRGEEVNSAAVRETLEECGIKTKVKKLLGVYSYHGKMEVVVVYVAEYGSPVKPIPEAVTIKCPSLRSTIGGMK